MSAYFFCFIVLSGICLPAHAQYRAAAIAFYNFENLFDPYDDPANPWDDPFTPNGIYNYTEAIYQQKLTHIASVLRLLAAETCPSGPALIGTAEIENARVLGDLVAHPLIREREYGFVHFDGSDRRGIDVALIYHPGQFRLLAARSLPVPVFSARGQRIRTRDLLYVAGMLGGDTIHVFVTHWPSRRGGTARSAPLRAAAAGFCRAMIDSVSRACPGQGILLMGDLNDDPVSPSITRKLGTCPDPRKTEAGMLYNPWTRFYRKGIGTLGYDDSWNLFDQILLSGIFLRPEEKGWLYRRAEVFNRPFLITRTGRYRGYPLRSFEGNRWNNGYSDHFPVLVYLVRKINP